MNSDAARKQPDAAKSAVEIVIETRARDLVEGFKVRRVLPSARRRMVGHFIFLGQMGPKILRVGKGLDVAPHPHEGKNDGEHTITS